MGAGTSGSTGASTSSATRRGSRRACTQSSTIPTARPASRCFIMPTGTNATSWRPRRSEEHTSELQSRLHLVCRLLLEKKKKKQNKKRRTEQKHKCEILQIVIINAND